MPPPIRTREGTGAGTLSSTTGSAAGKRIATATAAGQSAACTGSGSGTASAPPATRTGTGSGTLELLTGTGAGKRIATGTAAGQAAALIGEAAGTVSGNQATLTGTGAGQLAESSGSGTGARGLPAVGAGALAALLAEGAGVRAAVGAAGGEFPKLEGDAKADRVSVGSGAATLELLTGLAGGYAIDPSKTETRTGTGEGSLLELAGAGTAWTSPIVTVTQSELGGSEYPVRPARFPATHHARGRGRLSLVSGAGRGEVDAELPDEVLLFAEVA